MFRKYRHWNLLLIVALFAACGQQPDSTVLHRDKPASVGMDAARLDGNVQVTPDTLPMTPGKIFDMASITKPVATATSIMILVEQGRLRLMDPVTKFIPEFTRYIDQDGQSADPIRLYHLLTHTS